MRRPPRVCPEQPIVDTSSLEFVIDFISRAEYAKGGQGRV